MVKFFNDIASDEDYLGYNPYIEAFNYVLINNNQLITPPLVFGIHGKWGIGKTTFMNLIKTRIEKENKFYTVEINPWEYGKSQNFITVFVAKLYKEVKRKIELEGNESGINFIKAIFKPLKLSFDLKPLKIEYDFNKFSFDQQQDTINKYISENFALKESISDILKHDFFSEKKIVIFIDDLDRCDVNIVMEVIESIKLIFNSQNCIFFMGCDTNYLESVLSNKYESFIKFNKMNVEDSSSININDFSREYLEKIIQIPFYIPPIDGKSIKKYIHSIVEHKVVSNKKDHNEKINNRGISIEENIFKNFKKDLKDDFISELIIITGVNPRRIKRILNLTFLNYVFMKFKNVEKNNLSINTKLLAFICIIREVYFKFYRVKLSNEVAARKTFEEFFEVCSKDKNNEKENDIFLKEAEEEVSAALDEEIISPKDKIIGDTSVDFDKDILEKIHLLFDLYFKERKIDDKRSLNDEIYYISLYVSVNNLNSAESDSESEWGALAQIRSEITGKKLTVFLQMLSQNSPAKNLIYWFFNEIYLADQESFILGIVKNVNIYRNINNNREWLFKLDFNIKTNTLDIIFEWRNEYKSKVLNIDKIITSKKYDRINKKIQIDEDTTSNELEKIKDNLADYLNNISDANV